MNFYQFYNMQWKVESNGYNKEDFDALYANGGKSLLSVKWFTISAKLALEHNWHKHEDHKYASSYRDEVEAMLSAYLRSGYITGQEFVEIYEQFLHLMRVSYRNRKQWRRIE